MFQSNTDDSANPHQPNTKMSTIAIATQVATNLNGKTIKKKNFWKFLGNFTFALIEMKARSIMCIIRKCHTNYLPIPNVFSGSS